MKTPLFVACLAAGCLATTRAADAPVATFVDPDSPQVAEIRQLGEYAINRLALTLVSEVTVAVNKSGAEKALDVCHLKALPMTQGTIGGLPRITALKRTSLKLRNPRNAPDPAEQLALAHVQKSLEAGTIPKVLVQQVALTGGKSEWRVYRPVAVAPQCVTCHGPRDTFSPDLRARLAERYPDDQAFGYAAGQWRGLIRVTVGDAPPPPTSPPKKKT